MDLGVSGDGTTRWIETGLGTTKITRTYQTLQHPSVLQTGWKWSLCHVHACEIRERGKPLAVAVRVTHRWAREIITCERKGQKRLWLEGALVMDGFEWEWNVKKMWSLIYYERETKNGISDKSKTSPAVISEWHVIIAVHLKSWGFSTQHVCFKIHYFS